MKLSLLPVSYFGKILKKEMSIENFIDEAHKLSLDAIDLSILLLRNCSKQVLVRINDYLLERNLSILEVTTYPDFTHPDKSVRVKEVAQFVEDLHLAASVNAKVVRVTAGQAHPNMDRELAIEYAASNISKVSDIAKDLCITLVLENHSRPGVWDYYDLTFPTDNFIAILKRIPSDVKVQFDTANTVVYGDDPVKLVHEVANRIEVVHVADTHTKGILSPSLIGEGIVPMKEIFKVLKKYNYDGWLSIEEASNNGFEGLAKAVNYVREIWGQIN